MSSFFRKEERSSETVVDNEGFKNILKFLNLTGGYGSCKIGEFVCFIENVGGNLADHRKVSDLVSEEGIELRDYLMISDRCIRCLCCKLEVMRFSMLTIEMSSLCKKAVCTES